MLKNFKIHYMFTSIIVDKFSVLAYDCKIVKLRFYTTYINLRRFFSTFYHDDKRTTIYALATGGIPCPISVVRVSGPNARKVILTLTEAQTNLKPRQALVTKFYDPRTSKLLDKGILVWFPGPKSYTGEDSCEFHLHGSAAVVHAFLQSVSQVSGCRMAEPGEFTKRAFFNGKMDLTEVDGLSDLMVAETEMQRIQALQQMNGSLSRIYTNWRNKLVKNLAHCEAYIDFGEDAGLDLDNSSSFEGIERSVAMIIREIQRHLHDNRRGEIIRSGIKIAIIGKPNVGKSSLLNILSNEDIAIVSNIPGTTRDVVQSYVNFYGYPIIFWDTAGIRSSTEDEIESEGMRRSLLKLKESNLALLLVEPEDILTCLEENIKTSTSLKRSVLQSLGIKEVDDEITERIHLVLNKNDIAASILGEKNTPKAFKLVNWNISCKTLDGINLFRDDLRSLIADRFSVSSESSVVSHERYRSELTSCANYLQEFLSSQTQDLAIKTSYIKNAINSLGTITGHVCSEEVLDIVFKDFCIGK